MSEAIDDVGKLGKDSGVHRHVDVHKGVDAGLDLASELLEHEMLVLHLGHCTRRLEQALAVPLKRLHAVPLVRAGKQPFADESRVIAGQHLCLDRLDQAVVLGVEDVVDCRQADVLVAASITRDIVRTQQLIIIGSRKAIIDARHAI